METGEAKGGGDDIKKRIFKDIRRYYCEYCGVCRSKKSLIRSHVLAEHKEELEGAETGKSDEETEGVKKLQYTCQECDATFRKPAYLKQHMQGHSLEVYGVMSDGMVFKHKREALDPI